jgi:hypothetical protein
MTTVVSLVSPSFALRLSSMVTKVRIKIYLNVQVKNVYI